MNIDEKIIEILESVKINGGIPEFSEENRELIHEVAEECRKSCVYEKNRDRAYAYKDGLSAENVYIDMASKIAGAPTRVHAIMSAKMLMPVLDEKLSARKLKTEKEIREKDILERLNAFASWGIPNIRKEDAREAASAIRETQRYKKLGTIEEIKKAMELQKAKEPIEDEENRIRYTENYRCPSCNGSFSGKGYAKYCYHCGQKLDWGE